MYVHFVQRITKPSKPHTIGEYLVLSATKNAVEVPNVWWQEIKKIKMISLSNDTVAHRIN